MTRYIIKKTTRAGFDEIVRYLGKRGYLLKQGRMVEQTYATYRTAVNACRRLEKTSCGLSRYEVALLVMDDGNKEEA